MRLFGFIFALLAAIALAQSQNYINIPTGGLDVVAGQPLTITWQNPSSGTVTIRLTQGNDIEPNSGTLLTSNIAASAETATFTIPANVNNGQYNIAIVDDSNTSNINFSNSFQISGANSVQTSSVPNTSSTASASMSSSSVPNTSSSASSTNSSARSSASSSASKSSASASSSASSASSSASASASSTSHSTSSSASAASTTAAATTSVAANSAGYVHGSSLLAIIAGAVALL